MLCALRKLIKPKHPESAHRDFAANRHVHLYYSAAALGKLKLNADPVKSIKSFKQFYGGTTGRAQGLEAGFELPMREAPCSCLEQDCIHFAPPVVEQVTMAGPTSNFLKLQSQTMFCAYAKQGAVVAVAADDIDLEFPKERSWWLAEVQSKPKKVANSGAAHGIQKGEWVVEVKFCSITPGGSNGVVEYSEPKGSTHTIRLRACLYVDMTSVTVTRNRRVVGADLAGHLDECLHHILPSIPVAMLEANNTQIQ